MNKTTRCMPVYRSPSSRRAWIEMLLGFCFKLFEPVALLAEGVDRNLATPIYCGFRNFVALLAEGVDRNFFG